MNDPEVAELTEDIASAFMDTRKYFRALEVLRRLDTSTAMTTTTHIRIKLKLVRSFLALGHFKSAAAALEEVEEMGADGDYKEAMREAAVLYAATSRGLKDRAKMTACLEHLTALLDEILQSAANRAQITGGSTSSQVCAYIWFCVRTSLA